MYNTYHFLYIISWYTYLSVLDDEICWLKSKRKYIWIIIVWTISYNTDMAEYFNEFHMSLTIKVFVLVDNMFNMIIIESTL